MKKYLLLFLLIIDNAIYAQIPTPDLQMWYKADAGFSGFSWADQSGNGNTLSGIDAAPTQMAEGSHQFLRFSTTQITFPFPSTHWCDMQRTSGITWSVASTGTSIFMVYKSDLLTGDGNTAGLELGGASTLLSLFGCISSSQGSFRTGAASNNFTPSSSREILSGIFIPNNATGSELYRNGNLSSQVSTIGIPGNTTMNTIRISNLGVPADSYIDIYEVIVYSAPLSTTDRAQVQSYLAGKYSISLPLSLISFTGQKQNQNVLLQWQTENEVNTSKFEVERSTDGRAFEKIGIVTAANINGRNIYSFTDNEAWSSEYRLYKLKTIDIDGKFKYSNIIKLSNKKVNRLALFPNPAKDVITISSVSGKGEIKLFNIEGKELMKLFVTGQSQILDISLLAKGIYIIEVSDKNSMQHSSFVKQ